MTCIFLCICPEICLFFHSLLNNNVFSYSQNWYCVLYNSMNSSNRMLRKQVLKKYDDGSLIWVLHFFQSINLYFISKAIKLQTNPCNCILITMIYPFYLPYSSSLLPVFKRSLCDFWILWQEVCKHYHILLWDAPCLLHHTQLSNRWHASICHSDATWPQRSTP
jgi:hypothetical protein